jgi:Flp pilus assembly pilin Flp
MFLRKKAQSTAEYAILIALIAALAAGILQVALKGGIRKKHSEAVNYLLSQGDLSGEIGAADTSTSLYTQEYRSTTVDSGSFTDTRVMKKGGAEKRLQSQTTSTDQYTVETMEPSAVTP